MLNLTNMLHRVKSRTNGGLTVQFMVGRMFGVPVTEVGVMSYTLSWRGVWSRASAHCLKQLGVPSMVLRSIALWDNKRLLHHLQPKEDNAHRAGR